MKEKREKTTKKKRSFLRFLGWGALLPILAEAGVGILFLALHGSSSKVPVIAVGTLFALFGTLLIASVFLAGGGIFCLGAGAALAGSSVWLFVRPAEAANALIYVLVALLFVRLLLGIGNALGGKKRGGKWWEIRFFACLAVAVADFVLFFVPLSFSVRGAVLGGFCLCAAALELVTKALRLFSGETKERESRGTSNKGERETQKETGTADGAEGAPSPSRKRLFGRRKDGKS